MSHCLMCNMCSVVVLLDGGPQPIANRFLFGPRQTQFKHPKKLGFCAECGYIQIIEPVPAKELTPRFSWIRYNEPEGHLDELAVTLSKLDGLTTDSIIGGTSFKDDTLIDRLESMGFANTWRIDQESQLGIKVPGAGIETVQYKLPLALTTGLSNDIGKSDLFIARHIIEHASDMRSLIDTLKKLIKPSAYILFEVPCCDKQLEDLDYSILWEEHTGYFTPHLFKKCFNQFGLSLIYFERVHYPQEDSLVGVGKISEKIEYTGIDVNEELSKEIKRAEIYGKNFKRKKKMVKAFFEQCNQSFGKIAVFGAGHMGCTFVNLLQLGEYIDAFIDDNPNKAGLYMPGYAHPILPSKALREMKFKLCILSVNPAIEDKVIEQNSDFLEGGGRFMSIFAGSKYRMDV